MSDKTAHRLILLSVFVFVGLMAYSMMPPPNRGCANELGASEKTVYEKCGLPDDVERLPDGRVFLRYSLATMSWSKRVVCIEGDKVIKVEEATAVEYSSRRYACGWK